MIMKSISVDRRTIFSEKQTAHEESFVWMDTYGMDNYVSRWFVENNKCSDIKFDKEVFEQMQDIFSQIHHFNTLLLCFSHEKYSIHRLSLSHPCRTQ